MDGIVIIDKPAGWTSQDVTAKLRGVLPVFVGRATRAVEFFEHADKTYEAVLLLGVITDTEDTTGEILEKRQVCVTEADIFAVLPQFTGEIEQIPPMYSAIKMNGRKLYDLARKGQVVERKPRTVTIHSLDFLGLDGNQVRLKIHCSKGTYIRTLCKDLGEALGCGGCMAALRRVQAGEYTEETAVSLETLIGAENPEEYLKSVDTVFAKHPAVTLTAKQALRCRNGNAFSIDLPEGTYRAYDEKGEFLMLAKVESGVMSTIKSFFAV